MHKWWHCYGGCPHDLNVVVFSRVFYIDLNNSTPTKSSYTKSFELDNVHVYDRRPMIFISTVPIIYHLTLWYVCYFFYAGYLISTNWVCLTTVFCLCKSCLLLEFVEKTNRIHRSDLLTDAMRQKTHIHTHRYTVQTYTNVLTTKKNYHSFLVATRPSIESATIYGWVICVCIFSISNRDLLRRKSKMECFIPIENTHAFIYMYAVWVWYVLCILHT